MALNTVQDYVSAARTLLQDVNAERYDDSDFVDALNFGLLEARRLRADLFIGVTTVPSFTVSNTDAVTIDQQYRTPLLYFVAAHVQMQDEEDTQDSRAAMFLQKFTTSMLSPG